MESPPPQGAPPPQQPYAQPPAYAQPPPYPYYPAPPPAKGKRTLLIAIIVIVVVAVAGIGIAAFLSRGPSMALTNFQLNDQRSCLIGTGGNVLVSFDLVNTGGSGFARVAFQVDNATDHTNQYYVAGGSQLHVSDPVYISDCASHYVSVRIVSEFTG